MFDKSEKYLIVGFGGSGQRYFRLLKSIIPDCNIAVWNTGSSKINADGCAVITSMQEALQFSPKGVFVATPTAHHIRYAEIFLGKAEWILIDKPLDSNLNQCEVFFRNASVTCTRIYVNFQRRYLKCWQHMKQLILSNDNGNFVYGNVQVLSDCRTWRPNKPAEQLYALRRDLGGGVVLTECHEFDLIHWLLGDISKVTGALHLDGEIDTSASIILQLSEISGGGTISINLDFLSVTNRRTALFVFEHRRYEVEENSGTIRVYDARGNVDVITFQDNMEDAHRKLIKNVLTGDVAPTIYDGKIVNGIIDAVFNSAKKHGAPVLVKGTICPKEGEAFLESAIQKIQKHFGNRLIAVYGMGSLGYGGYVNGWSDFDIDALIDTDENSHKTDFGIGKEIENEIRKMGFDRIDIRVYSPKMLNERTTVLSYGQCSRAVMLCDSAVLLAGKDIRQEIVRPNIEQMDEEAIALITMMLNKGDEWWCSRPWDDIAAHFALVSRFYYSHCTGKVAGKRNAIEYLINEFPEICNSNQMRWMIWALACRTSYNQLYIQDCLHNDAVTALKEMFGKMKNYLVGGNK